MPNQSYLGIWFKDFPEEAILERFGGLLKTVPFSVAKPGFTYVAVRAVDPAEPPIVEYDLRTAPFDADEILEIVKDHLHKDCAYEVQAAWDLWIWDGPANRWKLEPQLLEISFRGEDYDNGAWHETGHIEVNFGFEHFFAGHAGLLGSQSEVPLPAESPEEARFMEVMAWPENLQRYQEKTQENIRKLRDWVNTIEKADSVERIRIWSEGDDSFEAHLEGILAAR